MSGMDRLSDPIAVLEKYRDDLCEGFCMEPNWSDIGHSHPDCQNDCGGCLAAAAILAHRRASQAAPAPSEKRFMRFSDEQMKAMIESDPDIDIDIPARMSPAPSDGLWEAAQWVNAAMVAIRGYERDLGVPMDDECEIGRIDDSRDSPSFRIRVGHIRRIAQALTPAPAQEGGE